MEQKNCYASLSFILQYESFIDRSISYPNIWNSFSCKVEYAKLYGPKFIAKVKNLVPKEKTIQKRPVNITRPSVCCFCPAHRYRFLFVHLKAKADSPNKYVGLYKCTNEEGLQNKISKGKAKLRKKKQKAKLEHRYK